MSLQVIYSYLLNSQGRVLFDLFVYKVDTNEVLVETDAALESSLVKVRLSAMENFECEFEFTSSPSVREDVLRRLSFQVLNLYKLRRSVSIESSPYAACISFETKNAGIIGAPDPRLPELGHKTIQGEFGKKIPARSER